MKVTNTNKKIFGGIVILILIGVVIGYYLTHREGEKLPTTSGNKRSENDSATRVNREVTPVEMGAKPQINPKDRSVKIVAEFIKLNAKNPATFEFLEWSEVSAEIGYWKVRCKYTGISSFNRSE